MNELIKSFNQEQMCKGIAIVNFRSGDLISVKTWIVEGTKRRLQIFEGIVIAIRNRGLHSTFTVRKITFGNGVERVFQTFSPVINSIVINRRGIVRKAKLYYLRNLRGKSARIKERLVC